MPVIETTKQTFQDPITPQLYGDVVIPETEFGSIGGVGVPEDYANVTGDHIFLDPSQPVDAKEGDIWYDSNDSNKPYKLVDGVWTSIRDSGAAAGLNIGQWVNNLVFAATDYNTVEWGTGTIKLQDGTIYTIDAGNTGNMAAVTYIFLDISVSLTVLQTTTTATNAVGTNRILVAVAKQNSDTAKDAEFQVFGGFGQNTFITADNIAANTITANEIVGNTITANKMDISTLSAISADLGTVTAGTITLPSGGFIRSGQTAYNTGTGFYLGNDSSVPRMSVGSPTGNHFNFDGTNVEVVGNLSTVTTLVATHAIEAGMNVSISASTGQITRTRATDFSTENSETATAANGFTQKDACKNMMLSISATVKLMFYTTSTGDDLSCLRIVVDPATNAVTSVTNFDITSAGGNVESFDVVQISSTAVVVAVSGGTNIYAKVLSGLDTTVTQGTELNAAAAGTVNGVAAAYVSASEIILFYYVAGTEVRSQKVTISGTTLTSSTTSTVYSTATDQIVRGACQYGTSNAYFICFSESTTTFRGIVGTYSSGTFTMGSAVTIESFDPLQTPVASIDDTRVFLAYTRQSDFTMKCRVMSRSGTTLTSNSAYSVATSVSGDNISLAKLGKYSFVVGYVLSGRTHSMQLLEVTSSTNAISQLGSTFNFSNLGNEFGVVPVYHSPTRILVTQIDSATYRTSTVDLVNNHSKWIGVAVSDIAESASGAVVTHGPYSSLSGLVTGELYYTDFDGGYNTITTGTRVGMAVAATSLIVRT